jgi:hypothetical protein
MKSSVVIFLCWTLLLKLCRQSCWTLMKLVTGIANRNRNSRLRIFCRNSWQTHFVCSFIRSKLQKNADTAGNGNSCHFLHASYEGKLDNLMYERLKWGRIHAVLFSQQLDAALNDRGSHLFTVSTCPLYINLDNIDLISLDVYRVCVSRGTHAYT